VIYLYGLLEPSHTADASALAALQGVTGEVVVTDCGAARLVHGPAEADHILPRRRHLLAHAQVLEAFTGGGAVLPMRFGMIARPESVATVLAAQAAEIAAQFDLVRACAEYGIRVSFPRDAALAATVAQHPELEAQRARLAAHRATNRMETAEFGRRLAEHLDRRRAAAQRDLLDALGNELKAFVLRAPDDDVQALAVDALVHESQATDLASRIEARARESAFAPGAEPQVRIVGPGPAYSFVSLTLETARWAA
jgi:uncharacterized protein (DUF2342 family)